MKRTKLCVCGRSQKFPICDNRHEEEGWQCASDPNWVEIGFCSAYTYQNLARKLASHFDGVTCLEGEEFPRLETLVIIVEGTDLEFPIKAHQTIEANRKIVVSLDVAQGLLAPHFPESKILDYSEISPHQWFKHIVRFIETPESPSSPEMVPCSLKSAFISHAVKDETLILPTMDYLRRFFGADLFTCADSIPLNTNWQSEIMDALETKDCFVLLLSEATKASHFCSFEIGAAYAWNKPMFLMTLDGTLPPAFIQHIQAINLPRIQHQKPWLDETDILIDCLLHALEKKTPTHPQIEQ